MQISPGVYGYRATEYCHFKRFTRHSANDVRGGVDYHVEWPSRRESTLEIQQDVILDAK